MAETNNNTPASYDFISKENQLQHLEDYNKNKQETINKLFAGKATNEGADAATGQDSNTANTDNGEQEAFYKTLRANGIFEKSDMDFNSKFYRFPRNDPYNYVDGAREYIFITKVELPLLDHSKTNLISPAILEEVPYFKMLWESQGYRASVFANLCKMMTDQPNSYSPFINILSNRKTSNLDIPDITVNAVETNVNAHGTRIFYPGSSIRSDEDVDFTLEFEDTPNLDIYHLFKAYDVYRNLKKEGMLGPGVFIESVFGKQKFKADIPFPENATQKVLRSISSVRSYEDVFKKNYPNWAKYTDLVGNKILYDHFALYKFLVANDGYTILFGYKIIGFYPSSIPRSAFSEIPQGGPLKLSIGFKVSGWVEDSDMATISKEFNDIIVASVSGAAKYRTGDEDIFEPFYQHDDAGFDGISQDAVALPFIRRRPDNGSSYRPYCLMWIKDKP